MKKNWKPSVGNYYYFADWSSDNCRFEPWTEILEPEDSDIFDFPVFKTFKACRKYCDRLNAAVRSVVP